MSVSGGLPPNFPFTSLSCVINAGAVWHWHHFLHFIDIVDFKLTAKAKQQAVCQVLQLSGRVNPSLFNRMIIRTKEDLEQESGSVGLHPTNSELSRAR